MMSSCRERVGALQPIFDEELFKHTVRRERKRTERSGLAMVMLSIGIQDTRRENTSALFAGIADALSVIKSDIDILGWCERESIMGLIVPEIDTHELKTPLSVIKGNLEVTLKKARSAEEYREALIGNLDQVERLS